MRDHNVPEWYIDSCLKIKYMFPKAHAAAYMISALRLGWYKVHRPVEYYAAYFSVRGEDFDGAVVARGRDAVRQKMTEINMKGKEASAKEEAAYSTLQIVNEMLARGIEVLPVDLYRSAVSLEEAKNDGGPYISIDDLQARSKVSRAVIDTLREAGALGGLPDSSQMSFF